MNHTVSTTETSGAVWSRLESRSREGRVRLCEPTRHLVWETGGLFLGNRYEAQLGETPMGCTLSVGLTFRGLLAPLRRLLGRAKPLQSLAHLTRILAGSGRT
nr:hypothetical protein [uncultured Holophaga sp.]